MYSFNIQDICKIAKKVGRSIIPLWENVQLLHVHQKDDLSPYTQADRLAHQIIYEELPKISNTIPILSEEGEHNTYKIRQDWDLYWCIDPIDGTKEFIRGDWDWTINIALIAKQTPILGVVYAPALNLLYYASMGNGAFINGNRIPFIKKRKNKIYKIALSKSHISKETNDFVKKFPYAYEILQLGSSLKICYIAQGLSDCYPRMSPTMEWDTAASDIIARESGAILLDWNTKQPLCYNKHSLKNPPFVATNSLDILIPYIKGGK